LKNQATTKTKLNSLKTQEKPEDMKGGKKK
jgi:hypothetical protein